MSEQEEIQATLAEHRAWTWNKFKEQNGAHVILENERTGESHACSGATGFFRPLCGAILVGEYNPALACWPTCKACAAEIYNLCRTSLPELESVQCEVSGDSGQLVLPNSENWGL